MQYRPTDVVFELAPAAPMTRAEKIALAHRRAADSQTRWMAWQAERAEYNQLRAAVPGNAGGIKAGYVDDPMLPHHERFVLRDFRR